MLVGAVAVGLIGFTPLGQTARFQASSIVTGRASGESATGYRLVGELPTGPDAAPVHRLIGPEDATRVRALAVALGLSAPLQQSGELWVARDPWRRLRVHRGTGAWAFETVPGRACSDVAAELGPGEELNCPPSSGGDPGSAVAGVLRSLGLQRVPQQGGRDELSVEVDPVVDGAQTDGFTTAFSIRIPARFCGPPGGSARPSKAATTR